MYLFEIPARRAYTDLLTVRLFLLVVRSSYHDPFYTQLCREAISRWKDRSEWGDLYHE